MRRILLNVEGETEEGFVNAVLAPHLYEIGYLSVGARLIGNSRARSRRGGIRSWHETKLDIVRHLRSSPLVTVGLMVDYYALPDNWPNKIDSRRMQHGDKANSIESAIKIAILNEMGQNFDPRRFAPLIMMHEYEALLFSNCAVFAQVVGLDVERQLQQILAQFGDPEKINDSPETAPSKRILKIIPRYQKPLHGRNIAAEIGLREIRNKCTHFNEWVSGLEINQRN